MGKYKEIAGQKFGRLTAIQRTEKKRLRESIWLCLCECETEVEVPISSLTSGKTRSCGCLKRDLISERSLHDISGKIFGRWKAVKRVRMNDHGESMWLCRCECGRQSEVLISNLTSGKSHSCGCLRREHHAQKCRRDVSGQVFGKLTSIKRIGARHKKSMWLCHCECGEDVTVSLSNLVTGNTKTCGICQSRVNGILSSKVQLEIAQMLKAQANYKVGSKYIDIALPEQKVAIEYDSWYWHGNKQEQDRQRANELISQGWKVLAIKSGNQTPSFENLTAHIQELESKNYVEIVLSDWGIGEPRECQQNL